MMRRGWLIGCVLTLVATCAAAQTQTLRVDRVSASTRAVIGSATFATTSPLQVVGLPGLSGTVLVSDGSGNVGTVASQTANTLLGAPSGSAGVPSFRALTTADLPLGTSPWTWTTAITLGTSSTHHLWLVPGGDLYLNPTGNYVLPATNYDINLGTLSAKYLTLHAAELWVETLVAQNTIATIGGRILVGPTTTLTADLGDGVGDTTITVKHNELASGDRVYLEANGKVEFLAVTSGASGTGPYTYSVTRDLDSSGRNLWYAGDALFNTGTTGEGFIDLYSVRGVKAATEYGPTIVGNVRASATYNDWGPRWAVGNLDGLYGYSATTYGFAAGNASATNVTVDATNGFRIRHGTTNKFAADTSGNLALTGNLTVSGSGSFGAGDVTLDSNGILIAEATSTSDTPAMLRFGSSAGSLLFRYNNALYIEDDDLINLGQRPDVYDGSVTTVVINSDNGSTTPGVLGAMRMTIDGTQGVVIDGIQAANALPLFPADDNVTGLGKASYRWSEIYWGAPTTTGDEAPVVVTSAGRLLKKTDGLTATFNPTTCTEFVFENGILVGRTCS